MLIFGKNVKKLPKNRNLNRNRMLLPKKRIIRYRFVINSMTYKNVLTLYKSHHVSTYIGCACKANLNNTIALLNHFKIPSKIPINSYCRPTARFDHNLASILQESGYTVGLYTSPHLKLLESASN